MSYPYEGKYAGVTYVFATEIMNNILHFNANALGTLVKVTVFNLENVVFKLGQPVTNLGDVDFTFYHASADNSGNGLPDFLKVLYGIGDGRSTIDNQHVQGRIPTGSINFNSVYVGAEIRGWKYGMMSAFPLKPSVVFRRDHFGQFRDMLEQRLDAKFYNESKTSTNGQPVALAGVKDSPVQVRFYDRNGNFTDPLLTLTSNLSFEATSSMPYTDGVARNRPAINYSNLNISNVTV
jgi:hypothetical protein